LLIHNIPIVYQYRGKLNEIKIAGDTDSIAPIINKNWFVFNSEKKVHVIYACRQHWLYASKSIVNS